MRARLARPDCESPICSSTASPTQANAHRKVGNLLEVKLRAIENLHAAGIDVCLVVTIVNTVNNDQVGPIVKFALQNCDKISFVSFQPVSFTGRDEDISDAERHAKRYTLSHLAEDLKRQTGVTEPLRDWYPLSASSVMSDVTDLMLGPAADWGSLKCGCHPDCGIGTAFMVSKKTKQWAPLASFVNVDRMLEDAKVISDAARGPLLTKIQTAMSLLRNYKPLKAPKGFRLIDLIRKYDKQSGGQLGGKLNGDLTDRRQDEWLLMFVAGMWFQDLWTYDFRRTEMCIIPVRHADGRNLILRVQHRRGLAADRGKHALQRQRRGLVQGARQARRVCQREESGAAASRLEAAHAEDSAQRRARRLAPTRSRRAALQTSAARHLSRSARGIPQPGTLAGHPSRAPERHVARTPGRGAPRIADRKSNSPSMTGARPNRSQARTQQSARRACAAVEAADEVASRSANRPSPMIRASRGPANW